MRARNVFLWVSPFVLTAALVGFLFARNMYAREGAAYWNENVAEQVRALVARDYVDDIGEDRGRALFYAAMEGYLRALDPYCSFYDPEERKAMDEQTSGEFGGVGVLVRIQDGSLVVSGLRRGGPAEQAGVRLLDVIAAVDGQSVAGLPVDDITTRIRGAPDTTVRVGLRRGEQTLELTLTRSRVKSDSVVGVRILDAARGIGYLRVAAFAENTGEDAAEALRHLLANGARSFILDLRQNHGGVLEQGAVALVDLFLTDGPIVETRGRGAASRRVYEATAEGTLCREEPLVVLVDGDSASAAEVAAGAVQDRRRGLLVGERTYGKFLVQSIHRLSPSDVALQITTARYYTPYGRWLQRRDDQGIRGGLLPDVVVARAAEDDRRMEELFGRQYGMEMTVVAEALPEPDAQLRAAADLLSDFDRVRSGGR